MGILNSSQLVGGRHCLDFANHLIDPDGPRDYQEVVAWSLQAGVLDDAEAEQLSRCATTAPQQANRTYERVVGFANSLSRLFVSVSQGEAPAESDLATLNRELAGAMRHSRLAAADGGFRCEWSEANNGLDRVLWPVARSAADLLVSREDLGRLKICDNHSCAWLFLDQSKNQRRRWCDMKVCGNRAKARRYRERHRQEEE